jgi:hypothetical protein
MKELKEHVDHLLQEKCNSYRIALDLPDNSLAEVIGMILLAITRLVGRTFNFSYMSKYILNIS